MTFRTVAIVGVGLIGGSFALALKKCGFKGTILGVSSPKTLEKAMRLGVIDAAASRGIALAEADLIYLAQPILRILEQLPDIARLARKGALVTDAGSTKGEIVRRARELFAGGALFLGGHPMAGKEGRGVEIAEAELFEGAVYALTPDEQTAGDPRVAEFERLLRLIGARPMRLTPDEHDRVTAWTSHLPQTLATALAAAVAENVSDPDHWRVAGRGLREMTRLAESPYEIWEGIFATNSQAIGEGLDRYIEALQDIRRRLDDKSLLNCFEAAQMFRKKLDGG